MSLKGCHLSKEHAEKIRNSLLNYWNNDDLSLNTRERISHKIRLFQVGKPKTELHIMHIKESSIGGFWYGNVRYSKDTKSKYRYCNLWNEDLKNRIRAFWNYKSAISGKTYTDNNFKELSCHHVYYQKSACCNWDYAEGKYYVDVNLGTSKNPYYYKYYIVGNPNKFVPLTSEEHSMTNSDKLDWIELFEKIIINNGGKSYFTKNEMNSHINLQAAML